MPNIQDIRDWLKEEPTILFFKYVMAHKTDEEKFMRKAIQDDLPTEAVRHEAYVSTVEELEAIPERMIEDIKEEQGEQENP